MLFIEDYDMRPSVVNKVDIDQSGILSINATDNMQVTILYQRNGKLEKIWESGLNKEIASIELLPGEYTVVYRSNTRKSTENTREKIVQMKSGKTYVLKI